MSLLGLLVIVRSHSVFLAPFIGRRLAKSLRLVTGSSLTLSNAVDNPVTRFTHSNTVSRSAQELKCAFQQERKNPLLLQNALVKMCPRAQCHPQHAPVDAYIISLNKHIFNCRLKGMYSTNVICWPTFYQPRKFTNLRS